MLWKVKFSMVLVRRPSYILVEKALLLSTYANFTSYFLPFYVFLLLQSLLVNMNVSPYSFLSVPLCVIIIIIRHLLYMPKIL